MKRKESKKFKRAVKLTFESLISHISWTVGKNKRKKDGSRKFHTKTIREYGEIILELCRLYERNK